MKRFIQFSLFSFLVISCAQEDDSFTDRDYYNLKGDVKSLKIFNDNGTEEHFFARNGDLDSSAYNSELYSTSIKYEHDDAHHLIGRKTYIKDTLYSEMTYAYNDDYTFAEGYMDGEIHEERTLNAKGSLIHMEFKYPEEYMSSFNRVEHREFNKDGILVYMQVEIGSGEYIQKYTYTYELDERNNRSKVISHTKSSTIDETNEKVYTDYDFDEEGNWIRCKVNDVSSVNVYFMKREIAYY